MDVKEYPGERGRLPHRRRHLQRGQPGNAPQNPRADQGARLVRRLRRDRQRARHAQPARLGNAESVLQRAYIENAQNNPACRKADGIVPQLLARVMPVHEVVHVNIFLPGCPPPADRIKALVVQVLAKAKPEIWMKAKTSSLVELLCQNASSLIP
jgi:hypothetical protein